MATIAWEPQSEIDARRREQLIAALRAERDQRLEPLLWLRDRHRDEIELDVDTTLSAEQFANVLRDIQALRDVPQQPGFPDEIAWPVSADD